MSAGSFMYLSQQCFSIVNGNASLENTRNAALVKFTVYYGEGFRPPDDSPGFYRILW